MSSLLDAFDAFNFGSRIDLALLSSICQANAASCPGAHHTRPAAAGVTSTRATRGSATRGSLPASSSRDTGRMHGSISAAARPPQTPHEGSIHTTKNPATHQQVLYEKRSNEGATARRPRRSSAPDRHTSRDEQHNGAARGASWHPNSADAFNPCH